MNSEAPDRLPDIGALDELGKERLIETLWQRLWDERARSQRLAEQLRDLKGKRDGSRSAETLRAELREASARVAKVEPPSVRVRLGKSFDFLGTRAALAIVGLVGLFIALDYGAGWYQGRALAIKRAAELRLEQAAYSTLILELVDVAYEPDGKSYRLTMSMENTDPDQPLYVMTSPVSVFEQAGLSWKEVPSEAPGEQEPGVVKLTGRRTFETVFEPNLEEWTELLPGYMHIRFDTNVMVSPRSEPEDDIVERSDPYYVYLKPHPAEQKAAGDALSALDTPPIFIPMPPH
jgi:hypothetical protein